MSSPNVSDVAVSKETWDSHNKMLLEPLAIGDSEVSGVMIQ